MRWWGRERGYFSVVSGKTVEMSGRRNCKATSRKCFVESMKSRVEKTAGDSKMRTRRPGA